MEASSARRTFWAVDMVCSTLLHRYHSNNNLSRKISERIGEPLSVQFLFQRNCVSVHGFNSVLFHETFPVVDEVNT